MTSRIRQASPADKPFVAWDGEGCKPWESEEDQERHPYCLFGSSLGPRIRAYDLPTLDCLRLMIETELMEPTAIHFGFAFGYDVNQIVKDLPLQQLEMLKRFNRTRWRGFSLEYIPRKWFRVGYGKGRRRATIKIFDVFSFFNQGLGSVLRKYDIGTKEQLDRIDKGKGERPNFTFDTLQSDIEPYWETELVLMVQLMENFRSILRNAGIHLNSWHGPGAIAAYLLRSHNVLDLMDRGIHDEIAKASRYAYFGGRFEPFMAGYYEGPIYSADINSAYPYSHSRLPSLSDGKWVWNLGRAAGNPRDIRLGIYRIRYRAPYGSQAMPLPHRSPSGSVCYPSATEGWYHAAEAAMVYNDPNAEFLESWIFEDDGTYPFAWIEDIYNQRLEMQRRGDPTQIALKLGPNSLYGAVARRAGWEHTQGPPKYHQLEWAGAITSECRSMVLAAARQTGNGLVSIDTDGVLSLRPFSNLPNGTGDRLGQWKVDQYSGLLYIQNGIYWLRGKCKECGDVHWLPPKSRGIPRKKLAFDHVYPIIARGEELEITQHMFIGFGLAMRGRMDDWRKWVDEPRTITFGGSGKRIHAVDMCPACDRGDGHGVALHPLASVPPRHTLSSPHYLPWLDKDETEFPVRETLLNLEKWGVFEDE